MNWHYVDANGQQAGPVDDATLNALVASGKITSETLVWREGMTNWQPWREVFPSAGSAPGPVASGIEEAVCAECGGIFPINDTIRVGNVRVCANCKPVFVQKMREGVNVEQPGTYHYAGFWKRFVAVFMDGILLGIVNAGIRVAFGLPMVSGMGNPNPENSVLLVAIVTVLQIFIAMSYETFMIGKYGATLGKMACKIHVIVADGGKVSYLRAFGRYFGKYVSAFTCLIGFIMAGFDSEKRALHDRICNTRVVFN